MLRPQTWYLLAAAIVTVVCAIIGAGTTVQLLTLILAAVVALAAIPLYKTRKRQAALCLLPILLILAWYILQAVNYGAGELSWHHALPAVAVLLVFMARKGILHDERVVRAYDRIR